MPPTVQTDGHRAAHSPDRLINRLAGRGAGQSDQCVAANQTPGSQSGTETEGIPSISVRNINPTETIRLSFK